MHPRAAALRTHPARPALLCLVLALLLAGCNLFTLFYENMDRYVSWRVARYVTLRPEQQRLLDQEFARLWSWHRRHQLPLYAMDLRRLATALQGPVDAGDVTSYVQRAEEHWQVLAREALPGVCQVLGTLDDRQIRELLKGLDRDNTRFYERHVEPPAARRRVRVEERHQRAIERWIGPLTTPQLDLLQRWSGERDDLAGSWLAFRLQWRQHFAEALAQRRQPGACARLEPLLVRPLALMDDELGVRAELSGRRWSRMIAALVAAMDPQQHRVAQQRLRDFATRLEQLVRTSA